MQATQQHQSLPRGAPFVALLPTFAAAAPPASLPLLESLCRASTRAFAAHLGPRLTDAESTGGAYFLPAPEGGATLAVLKPEDEEPFALNNPKGHVLPPAEGEGEGEGGGGCAAGGEGGEASAWGCSDDEEGAEGAARNAEVRRRALSMHARVQAARGEREWMRKGVAPGDGVYREVAAWLLDHGARASARSGRGELSVR